MQEYEGRAQLQWWADPQSAAFSAPVDLVIAPLDADGSWDTRAVFPDMTDDDKRGIELLCGMDGYFTVDFPDGSTVAVALSGPDEHGAFTITEA